MTRRVKKAALRLWEFDTIVSGTVPSSGVILIEEEPISICEMCGKKEELRPYGPCGENICFDCGMKDEEAAKRAFAQRLAGD